MQTSRLAFLVVGLPVAAVVSQSERHTLSGDNVAIYNLVGVARIEAGSGSDVVVEITRGGGDAAKLRVVTGPVGGREALRVIYPDDEITYPELSRGSSTTLDVRDDGTFNDHAHRGGYWRGGAGGGHRVRISGSGGGLDGHADLRIAVPAGKRVAVYVGVGRVFVSNVSGDLGVHVATADVTADHTRGPLDINTGSGNVRVSEVEGKVSLNTGSGDVVVNGMRGSQLNVDTGSGNVTADRVVADVLRIDTGSGEVKASGVRARDANIDTGSGEVRLGLLSDLESLYVDTGSGDVSIDLPADFGAHVDIDTGSGGIDLRGVEIRTTRLEKDHLTGEIGDGRGEMKVSTGSGGITLQRL